MSLVAVEAKISAPLARVYELAKDVEKFPEFMPDVEEVKVLERQGNQTKTRWVGKIKEFNRTIQWTEQDSWNDEEMRCEFEQTEGDFALYRGIWEFHEEGEGTAVALQVEYEYNVPLIGALIKGVIFKKMKQNCQNMLDALKQEAEKVGS